MVLMKHENIIEIFEIFEIFEIPLMEHKSGLSQAFEELQKPRMVLMTPTRSLVLVKSINILKYFMLLGNILNYKEIFFIFLT